ncbi:hypothetical protein ZIOFF_032524 [Zingiber officinale]|uniref:Nucleotide-diphospho-sugar transferase domain-containing protein n=1 Tax=Zingiber officinale TaxID=94328 RepID=A0A8J5GNR3_ZINOF|nr:hypothetical protein ZIOFF_032524 [Zingiber officinale]
MFLTNYTLCFSFFLLGSSSLFFPHRHEKTDSDQSRALHSSSSNLNLVCHTFTVPDKSIKLLRAHRNQDGFTGKETRELKRLLKGAANNDNMVIIAMLDEAQNSVFDLFIQSFKVGNGTSSLLNHLVVLALDREGFERCGALHSHCYFPKHTSNLRGSRETMMMARQIDFSRQVLELAYNLIYTDLDVMWFRNPVRQFDSISLLILATERYRGERSFGSRANGAFMFVLSADQTIEFFRTWRLTMRMYAGEDRAAILTRAVREGTYNFGPKVQLLDTDLFGDVCRRDMDLREIYTARAGCCMERGDKLSAMRALARAWRNYTAMSVEEGRSSSAIMARYKCRS